eukprot:480332-Pleurochrysis_carterae.AAC.1
MSVSEARSWMENSHRTSTPTSGRETLAVNSPSGLKGNRRGRSYVLVGTLEEAELGRDPYIKDKDDTEEAPAAVPKPSAMDMAGTLDVSAPCDARPLEVKDDAYSGLLARVRGSSDPRAMRDSRLSRDGGGHKGHSESVPTVHGTSDLGMAGAFDVSSPRDARPLEVKDNTYSGLLARVRGSPDPKAMRTSRSSRVGGGNKDHSKSVPMVHGSSGLNIAGALEVLSPDDAQQPEVPVPETKDPGRTGVEEEAEVPGSETAPDLDEMKVAGADPP